MIRLGIIFQNCLGKCKMELCTWGWDVEAKTGLTVLPVHHVYGTSFVQNEIYLNSAGTWSSEVQEAEHVL